jgi:hypothetical protein
MTNKHVAMANITRSGEEPLTAKYIYFTVLPFYKLRLNSFPTNCKNYLLDDLHRHAVLDAASRIQKLRLPQNLLEQQITLQELDPAKRSHLHKEKSPRVYLATCGVGEAVDAYEGRVADGLHEALPPCPLAVPAGGEGPWELGAALAEEEVVGEQGYGGGRGGCSCHRRSRHHKVVEGEGTGAANPAFGWVPEVGTSEE